MPYEFNGPQLIISFIILFIISALTAIYAEKKGRSPIAWFLLGILFSFLAPLVLFLLPPLKKDTYPTDASLPPSPPKTPEDKNYVEGNKFLEEDRLWYYLDSSHNQFGPISVIGLRELWNRAQIKLNTYVWTAGMDKWETIENVPSLQRSLTHMKELL